MEPSKSQRELLVKAYEEIFADASTLEEVKAAILRIIGEGGFAAALLLKDMGDRLEGPPGGNYVH